VDGADEAPDLLGAQARVPDGVVYRTFASETVVLNLETGLYHGLNPTAGRMLETIERVGSVGAAAEALADEYARPLPDVQRDLCKLCQALVERRLLIVEHA
jgi:hypothetical protein